MARRRPEPAPRLAHAVLRRIAGRAEADAQVGDLLEAHGGRAGWRMWLAAAQALGQVLTRIMRSARFVVRDALRATRATPASTIFAIAILTLGIAAATVTFSVVDAVILRSLPFDESDRLVMVGPGEVYGEETLTVWRERLQSLDGLVATWAGPLAEVPVGAEVLPRRAWRATASMFDVLRVQPALGRAFTEANEVEGNHAVAVLAHDAWMRDFGGDPGVIGQWLPLRRSGGLPAGTTGVEVIGVMPPDFRFPVDYSPSLWMPHVPRNVGGGYLQIIGRLGEGVSLTQAQAEMDVASADLRFRGRPTLVPLLDAYVGDVRGWMLLALGAAVVVLIVAAVNVANLMLARAVRRTRELAVRAALGASGAALAATLLAEGLMLAAISATLGLGMSWWALDRVLTLLPQGIARVGGITIDGRVLAVALVTCLATGLLVALVPALRALAGRFVLAGTDAPSAAPRSRWPGVFVTAEVGFVAALLVVSTLFAGSFVRVVGADLGFDRDNLLWFRLEDQTEHLAAVVDAVEATPGIASVATLTNSPLLTFHAFGGSSTGTALRVSGDPAYVPPQRVLMDRVGPEYFETAQIDLVRGRLFDDDDDRERVVVIDQEAAFRFFPDGRDPIGRELEGGPDTAVRIIIGVVRAVSAGGPEAARSPHVYFLREPGEVGHSVLMRTDGPPAEAAPRVSAAIASVLPAGANVPELRSLEEAFVELTRERRLITTLMSLFGGVALLIGAAGVYAVMAASVAGRGREFGIRVALGASRGHLIGSVVRRALALMSIGLVLGLAAGRLLSELFASLLFEVRPGDAWVYAIVAVILAVVGLLAALGPARRASRVDPLVTLRAE